MPTTLSKSVRRCITTKLPKPVFHPGRSTYTANGHQISITMAPVFHVFILPYLEQGVLYDQYDRKAVGVGSVFASGYVHLGQNRIPAYLYPGDLQDEFLGGGPLFFWMTNVGGGGRQQESLV